MSYTDLETEWPNAGLILWTQNANEKLIFTVLCDTNRFEIALLEHGIEFTSKGGYTLS